MFAKFLSYLIFIISMICKLVIASDLEDTQPNDPLIFRGHTIFNEGKFDESYLIESNYNYIPELNLNKDIAALQIGIPNSESVYPAKYIEFTPKSKLYLMPSGRIDCYQNTYLNNEIVFPSLLAVNKINVTSKMNITTKFNNAYNSNFKNTIKKCIFKKPILNKLTSKKNSLNQSLLSESSVSKSTYRKPLLSKKNSFNHFNSLSQSLQSVGSLNKPICHKPLISKCNIEKLSKLHMYHKPVINLPNRLCNNHLNTFKNSYNADKLQYSDKIPGFFVHDSILTIGKNAKFNKISGIKKLPVINLLSNKSQVDLHEISLLNTKIIINSVNQPGVVNLFENLNHDTKFKPLKKYYKNLKNSKKFNKILLQNVRLLNPTIYNEINEITTIVKSGTIQSNESLYKQSVFPENIKLFNSNSTITLEPYAVESTKESSNITDNRLSWKEFLNSDLNSSSNILNLNIQNKPFKDWNNNILPLGGSELKINLKGTGNFVLSSSGTNSVATFNCSSVDFNGTITANNNISKIVYKKEFVPVVSDKSKHNCDCQYCTLKNKEIAKNYEFSGRKYTTNINLNENLIANSIRIAKNRTVNVKSGNILTKSLHCSGKLIISPGSSLILK